MEALCLQTFLWQRLSVDWGPAQQKWRVTPMSPSPKEPGTLIQNATVRSRVCMNTWNCFTGKIQDTSPSFSTAHTPSPSEWPSRAERTSSAAFQSVPTQRGSFWVCSHSSLPAPPVFQPKASCLWKGLSSPGKGLSRWQWQKVKNCQASGIAIQLNFEQEGKKWKVLMAFSRALSTAHWGRSFQDRPRWLSGHCFLLLLIYLVPQIAQGRPINGNAFFPDWDLNLLSGQPKVGFFFSLCWVFVVAHELFSSCSAQAP